MPTALQCYDRAILERLLTRGGSAAEIETLASHLETCARCGTVFDDLLRQDQVTLGLLKPGSASDVAESPTVKHLRDRLIHVRPASAVTDTTAGLAGTNTGTALPAAMPLDTTEAGLAFLSPAQEPDEIGRLGAYRVLRTLGAGGMGMVFLAEDSLLQRKVALKTMLPDVAANPQARVRFLREAQAAAAIEHPHIVTIHQVGEDNGVPFLVMPLLKGESLEARLAREKQLPLNEAIRITCEMAEGLAAAHAQGLIHRDIKPGNVWLEEQPVRSSTATQPPRVKLLDFGLARAQADEAHLTQSGAIIGTPAFMAPEQARGEHVDARADLFSLGCVLYVMLTGQRPFSGATTMALLTALAVDTPKAPRAVNPDVPAALSDFTMRLLAKQPAGRPASAEDALDELRTIVRAEANVVAEHVTLPYVGSTSALRPAASPRRPRVALHIGLALVLLIVGAFAAYQLLFKTKDGTLIVEVDGDADVRFQKGALRIYDSDGKLKYTLKPSEKNKELPPGKYLVEIVGVDGLKVVTDKFEIIRGDKATVRVTVAEADEPRKSGLTSDTERQVAEWLLKRKVQIIAKPTDGKPQVDVTSVDQLPKTHFHVVSITVLGESWSDEHLQQLVPLKALRSLVLGWGNQFTDAGIERFTQSPTATHLEWVEFQGRDRCEITDAGVAHFRRCPELVQLNLGYCKVSDRCLDSLRDLDKLQIICLDSPFLTDAVLDRIDQFPNVTSWSIGGRKVTDAVFEKVASAKLQHLGVRNSTRVTGRGLRHLNKCSSLRSLTLTDTNVDDDGFGELGKLPELEFLHLNPTKISDAALKNLARFPKLRWLGLEQSLISDTGLVDLKGAANLESLKLASPKVTDAGLPQLKALTKLKELHLVGCKVTADGVKKLSAELPGCKIVWDGGTIGPTTSLELERQAAEWVLSMGGKIGRGDGENYQEFLSTKDLPASPLRITLVSILDNPRVTNADLERLKALTSLKHLGLRGHPEVNDAGLEHLRPLTKLRDLRISSCPVTDAGIKHLQGFPELHTLTLSETQITDAGLKLLPPLKVAGNGFLDLSQTSTGDKVLDYLKTLQRLDQFAAGRHFTDDGLQRLKTVRPELWNLNLDATAVTDVGLKHLPDFKNLKELNLVRTKVTQMAVNALHKTLPGCRIIWDGGILEPKK